jgi:predicted ATP-dependent endonuclease of OLD family
MLHLGDYERGKPFQDAVRRKLDELAIKANSASISMTNRFQEWWEQRKHQFRYDFQGEYFRVWVSDDLDPSEIELDQRSLGLQYFFSFYLVFLVESAAAHKGCILLLDEPGLHLHGTAQAKVITFLGKLARDNQTLYSTHSPFLVDGDHLEQARAVYEKEDGTTGVSEDVWPRDKDSLFPLQAALGYQLAQSLFLSKRQLLVEGITDYWLIKTIAEILPSKNLPTLRGDITLVPAAGLTKLLPLASMLIGHEIEIGALLDGDEPARKEGKKLVEKLLAGEDRRCLFIGDFLDGRTAAEIEDVFPEDCYLAAVKEAYPQLKLVFTAEEQALAGIANKLTALFNREGVGRFEKWRVAAVLRDWLLQKPASVPESVFKTMSKIFESANAIFGKAEAEKKPC